MRRTGDGGVLPYCVNVHCVSSTDRLLSVMMMIMLLLLLLLLRGEAVACRSGL